MCPPSGLADSRPRGSQGAGRLLKMSGPIAGPAILRLTLESRENFAPHPAFGHPLPAYAGRGATTLRVPLLPARGEKVPEGRMRGVSLEDHMRRTASLVRLRGDSRACQRGGRTRASAPPSEKKGGQARVPVLQSF